MTYAPSKLLDSLSTLGRCDSIWQAIKSILQLEGDVVIPLSNLWSGEGGGTGREDDHFPFGIDEIELVVEETHDLLLSFFDNLLKVLGQLHWASG